MSDLCEPRCIGVCDSRRRFATVAPTLAPCSETKLCGASQPMSKVSDNLNARRDKLGLRVDDVVAELARRGIDRAYSTVAGWFNGSRGSRWNMDELRALLDVLQTDLDSITEGQVELVEQKLPAATAREMAGLSEEQQQAVLAMVRAMSGNKA